MGLLLRAVLTHVDRIEYSTTDSDPASLLILEADAELYPVLCPPAFAGSALERHLQGLVGTIVVLPVVSSPAGLRLADGSIESEA